MAEDTAGDPMGRRGVWTGKRLRDISAQLALLGLCVCPSTVRRLLLEIGYALHANRKSLCAEVSPWREQQFEWLNYQRRAFDRGGYLLCHDTHCPPLKTKVAFERQDGRRFFRVSGESSDTGRGKRTHHQYSYELNNQWQMVEGFSHFEWEVH